MNENNINSNRLAILDSLVKLIPVSLAFLVPIFFLPITLEFYAFNKIFLVIIASILLIIYWAVKMMLGQKMNFTKSILDLPLLTYFFVATLATFFSISKVDSVYGSQGRWAGLFSFAAFLIYFFLSTPLLKDIKLVKMSFMAMLFSTTICSLVSLFSYYNIYLLNTAFSKIQSFNLLGSVTDTVFVAAIALVASLGFIGYAKNLPFKILLIVSAFINYMLILVIGLPIGFISAGAGVFGLLVYMDLNKVSGSKFFYGIASLLLILITLLTILPGTKDILISKNFPKESTLSVKESWLISSTIIQNYPLLATGPSTYYLNFSRYRPLSMNTGENWGMRFDMPKNEFFNIMGTLGLVGVLASIFLLARMLKLIGASRKGQDDTGISKILSAAMISLIVGHLFTFATIATMFYVIIVMGMLVAIHALSDKQGNISESVSVEADALSSIAGVTEASVIKKEYFRFILCLPILAATLYAGYLAYRNYMGEFYMRKSLMAAARNDGKATYDLQRTALTINPTRDTYHTTYAQTNLAIANSLASNENLTDTDRETIQNLIAQSIRSARVATEVVGPINPANWEVRSLVYRSLINIAQNATDWAVGSYNTAIQLDPSNPRLRVELGGMYYSMGDFLSAANQFRQAYALKGDYANAYYNFANSLIQLKDYQNALSALNTTRNLIPQDSPDRKVVDDLIATLQTPQVAGASTEEVKPTVEQLVGEQVQSASQEPLINAGETPKAVNENIDLGSLPKPEENQ